MNEKENTFKILNIQPRHCVIYSHFKLGPTLPSAFVNPEIGFCLQNSLIVTLLISVYFPESRGSHTVFFDSQNWIVLYKHSGFETRILKCILASNITINSLLDTDVDETFLCVNHDFVFS